MQVGWEIHQILLQNDQAAANRGTGVDPRPVELGRRRACGSGQDRQRLAGLTGGPLTQVVDSGRLFGSRIPVDWADKLKSGGPIRLLRGKLSRETPEIQVGREAPVVHEMSAGRQAHLASNGAQYRL